MGFSEVKKQSDSIQRAVEESSILVDANANKNVIGLNVKPGIYGMETYATSLNKLSETLKSSMFKMLFMGSFKNGKSTTINAILGEKLLPVGVTATTAIISQVVYGTDTQNVKIFTNNSSTPKEVNIKQFNEDYKLNKEDKKLIANNNHVRIDRFKDIDYALLNNDCPMLKDGVIVIDSPGLEEDISRTKTTQNFFSQAHAIIFLLHARKLFSGDEKEFIKSHFIDVDPKPRNVFFLVNFVNMLNDEDEYEEVKNEVEDNIKQVFTINNVVDDNLFKKRLFFVDSHSTYNMKKNNQSITDENLPVGIKDFNRFQNELEAFLTSEDKFLARYQSVAANMAAVYLEARRQIEEANKLLKKPLEVLEKNQKESEKKLKELENEIKTMQNTISGTQTLVESKILTSLEKLLKIELAEIWKDHVQTYDDNNDKLGILDLVRLALPTTSDAQKNEILKPITSFVQTFIEEQIIQWADRSSKTLIKNDLDNLKNALDCQSKDFDLKLSKAREIFISGDNDSITINEGSASKLQLALSIIQGDISVAVENASGSNYSWGEFAKRYIFQALVNILIAILLGGGIPYIIGWVAFELAGLHIGANNRTREMLNKFAEKLFPRVCTELLKDENKEVIVKDLRAQFKQLENDVTSAAINLIEDERKSQQQIIEQKTKTETENRIEYNRQHSILNELLSRTNFVYETIYNHKPTDDNLKNLAATVVTNQMEGA